MKIFHPADTTRPLKGFSKTELLHSGIVVVTIFVWIIKLIKLF